MRLLNFVHGHHLAKTSPDFWRFELSIWLHAVGRAMIGIFIPFLILQMGYSLRFVIFYYLIFNILDIPFNLIGNKLVRWIGAKKTIIVATLFSITYFALLSYSPAPTFAFLVLLATLDAFYDSSYWVSHVYLFLKSSHSSKNAGRQTGILHSMRTLAAAVGPMIGGIALMFGLADWLIWVSIAFFAVSIIPLFRLQHTSNKPRHEVISVKDFFSERSDRKNFLTIYLIQIIGAAESILWPLFVFTLYGTTESIAYVAIALSLGAAAFSYMAGLIEEHGRTLAIILGAFLITLTWIFRMNFDLPAVHFGTITAMGFFILLMMVPNDCRVYSRGRERASLHTATFRNMTSMSGYLTLFIIVALSKDIFQAGYITVLVAAVAIMTLHLFPSNKTS